MYLTVIYFLALLCIFIRSIVFSIYSFKNSGVLAGIGVLILAAGIAAAGVMSVMSI